MDAEGLFDNSPHRWTSPEISEALQNLKDIITAICRKTLRGYPKQPFQDALNETAFKIRCALWQGNYNPVLGRLEKYATRIAQNTCRSIRKRHLEQSLREQPIELALAGELPARSPDTRESDLEAVRSALAELPDHLRIVMELRFLTGDKTLSYVNIALSLKCSETTVRRREKEAIRLLRARLSNDQASDYHGGTDHVFVGR